MTLKFMEFVMDCYRIFREREGIYKNAYKTMPSVALLSFIIGKTYRVMSMLEVNGSSEKVIDDLKDIVNYCYMLYEKLGGENR